MPMWSRIGAAVKPPPAGRRPESREVERPAGGRTGKAPARPGKAGRRAEAFPIRSRGPSVSGHPGPGHSGLLRPICPQAPQPAGRQRAGMERTARSGAERLRAQQARPPAEPVHSGAEKFRNPQYYPWVAAAQRSPPCSRSGVLPYPHSAMQPLRCALLSALRARQGARHSFFPPQQARSRPDVPEASSQASRSGQGLPDPDDPSS